MSVFSESKISSLELSSFEMLDPKSDALFLFVCFCKKIFIVNSCDNFF